MSIIRTEKLTKYYGTSRGIVDVDLEVKEGDVFGFIGPNGAGKSTAIRILLGLISPTSGRAEIFGKDISKSKDEILSDIGYLPSETAFYSGMKVGEVLKLSADLRKRDCTSEAKLLCERLSLDLHRKVGELSLGNRKKVGIVAALQHKPSLYILDEPTSGLDPLMQREFYALLSERSREGATVFLSSHILTEVEKYCKRAAVIRDGRILVSDTVENLGHTGTKRVILDGASALPKIPEIKNVKSAQGTLEFLYSGDIKLLLSELRSIDFNDISITEPDLEEIFMHYYKEDARDDTL